MSTDACVSVHAAGYGCDSSRRICRGLQTTTGAASIPGMNIVSDLTKAAFAS
jgi:hypothetical protein